MKLTPFKRLLRHLFVLPNAVNKRFPKDAMRRIETAIAACETLHSGEIRFAVESNLSLSDLMANKPAQRRALEIFSRLHVWDTEQNNGVLIYLLLADHDFEIIADRGIHQHVGNQGWQRISHEMEVLFRQGRFEAGVLHGISKISDLLVQYYPCTERNPNELSNAPVVI